MFKTGPGVDTINRQLNTYKASFGFVLVGIGYRVQKVVNFDNLVQVQTLPKGVKTKKFLISIHDLKNIFCKGSEKCKNYDKLNIIKTKYEFIIRFTKISLK